MKYPNIVDIDPQLRNQYILDDELLQDIYVLYSSHQVTNISDTPNIGVSTNYISSVKKASDPIVDIRNPNKLYKFNTHVEQARSVLYNSTEALNKAETVKANELKLLDLTKAITDLQFIQINQQQDFLQSSLTLQMKQSSAIIAMLENILHELQEINIILRNK